MKMRKGDEDVVLQDLTPVFAGLWALGILTRSAPQLNIFAIGFPITLGVGLIVLNLTLPYFGPLFEQLIQNGLKASSMMIQTLRPG
jgi:flagellar biosynthetic protein FliR